MCSKQDQFNKLQKSILMEHYKSSLHFTKHKTQGKKMSYYILHEEQFEFKKIPVLEKAFSFPVLLCFEKCISAL